MTPPSRPRGLGRGLATLIPDAVRQTSAPGAAGFLRIPLDRVSRNPEQPREHFDPEALAALAESIRAHGVLQPILVRAEGDRYVLVAGERRWRASGMAGLTEIPALVTDRARQEQDVLLLALVENLQRRDLNVVEEAQGYQRLAEAHGLSHETIAAAVGRDRTSITNLLRLLRLPPHALDALREGRISAGHGKALLALQDPGCVPEVQAAVEERGLSVRATERLVDSLNRQASVPARAQARRPAFAHAEKLLGRHLGTTVQIKGRSRGGGRIVIEYGSDDELTTLVEKLRGPE